MDDQKIPEDMTQVAERVALMTERGFPVAEEDVIKEALRAGFQSIVDERLDGNYYTVRWDEEFNALQMYDLDNAFVGEVKPDDGRPSYVDQFKQDAMGVWFTLDRAVGKVIGR